jgi:cysteine desulfurase
MTYLDWASTSPPKPDLLSEAAALAAEFYGNPSSNHALGQAAKARLEEARGRLAASLGAKLAQTSRRGPTNGERLIFTSGGSEADAIVLLSFLRRREALRDKAIHIVTTSVEHAAIYEEARIFDSLGIEVSFVNPGADGLVNPEAIAAAMRKETALVAVMAVNNETGAIMPLSGIRKAIDSASAQLGRSSPPLFHSDAVQALGKIPFRPRELGLSSAAFSSHKLRGPRGTGALWLNAEIAPLALGGGQEGGIRSGTENLQAIWAFSRAAEEAQASLEAHIARARELEARLIGGLSSIAGALPLPLGREAGDPRYSPFVISASFPGLSGEVFARALSDDGVAVSTGSACSSNGAQRGRRVLEAMGLRADLAFSAIRVSTGYTTQNEDIDRFLEAAGRLYRRYKA